MEVAKKSAVRDPPKNVYGILCGILRHLEKHVADALNALDNSDRR